jgi:SAM-dependent methyltransferase
MVEKKPLYLNQEDFYTLLANQGPSLGLWRAAEVAALREQAYDPPVLDLGCGDALVSSLVVSKIDFGFDPDPVALEKAKRRGIYRQLEALPVEQAGLARGSIRTVLSNSVLEHIPNLDEVLAEVGWLLEPGGRLIFTAPTEAFSGWLTFPLVGYANHRNRQFAHRNLWPLEEWAEHLQQAGLEITCVRPYLRHPLVALWDFLELLQQVRIFKRRMVGMMWRAIPAETKHRLAGRASRTDLSAQEPGGGRLIVAEKS